MKNLMHLSMLIVMFGYCFPVFSQSLEDMSSDSLLAMLQVNSLFKGHVKTQPIKILGHAVGDLNKDSISDLVLVVETITLVDDEQYKYHQDKELYPKIEEERRHILVYKGGAQGGFSLWAMSPNDLFVSGDVEDLAIERGCIVMQLRWFCCSWRKYRFRYQNEAFFLIGASSGEVDLACGGESHMYDFNISTGQLDYKYSKEYCDDKLPINKKVTVWDKSYKNKLNLATFTFEFTNEVSVGPDNKFWF